MRYAILLGCALGTLTFGGEAKPNDLAAAKRQPAKVLERFVVSEDSTLSFGLALKVLRYSATKKVAAIYVDEVEEGSDAARQGVRAGMQIVSFDGKAVIDFDATFQKDSELRKLLIGRKRDDMIVVVIDPLDGTKPITLTLSNHAHYRVQTKETNPLKQEAKDDKIFGTPVFQK